MSEQTWTIMMPCGELLTANQRSHWALRHRATKLLRSQAGLLARSAQIPALRRVHVTAWMIPPDLRKRDPDNWHPSVKACVDGLVDAGVVLDDDASRLTQDIRGANPERCPHCAPFGYRRVHLRLDIRSVDDPIG